MRIPRKETLTQPSGITHVMWRCHDKKPLLKSPEFKQLYMQNLEFALDHESTDESVQIHCFALMDNHVHKLMSYKNDSEALSDFMRIANSRFAAQFNRRNKRSGAVLNDRPKTCLVGDPAYEMRVQFYIEANPLRANKDTTVEALRYIPWNSYRYYAYGVIDEYTKILTPPRWYLDLGKTDQERQERYRKLFLDYVAKYVDHQPEFSTRFIGESTWVQKREIALKAWRTLVRQARQGRVLTRKVQRAQRDASQAPPE